MPHVGHQFRVRPGQPSVAPLAAPPPPQEPDPFGEEPDAGFGEEEAGRVEPKPRPRIASTSSAAAAPGGGAQATAIPGGTRSPFLGRLTMSEWDVNPYKVARDLLGK